VAPRLKRQMEDQGSDAPGCVWILPLAIVLWLALIAVVLSWKQCVDESRHEEETSTP